MKLWFLLVCAAIVLHSSCQGEDSNNDKESQRRQKLLVGVYSQRTEISLTTFTSAVPSTCIQAANHVLASPCKRRRRRRMKKNLVVDVKENNFGPDTISPSVDQSAADKPQSHRQGRLKITFWSATTSTYTFVSTSIITGQTFSVSYFCSLPGFSYPPVCG